MTNDNNATAYLAGALRDMTTHILCHHYHRDGALRMDKVLFDLCNVTAHTLRLLYSALPVPADPPRLSHSTPEEPH